MMGCETITTSWCPDCGYECDRVSRMGRGSVEEGDIGICLNCGALHRINDIMVIELASKEDLDALTEDEAHMVAETIAFIKKRGLLYPRRRLA